jgi:branched-chain amino acid transport system substrate-binding protein
MQRVRSLKPDVLFGFLPVGPPTFGFVKSYNENGLRAEGIRFLGTAETSETELQALGAPALGLETGYYYSGVHDSPENKAFLASLAKVSANAVANPYTVSAFDGTHVLYKMVEATGGKQDADKAVAAVKGMAWNSPRGPMKIDAATRDVVQNVYIRKIERDATGKLVNREFKTYDMQPDYGRDAAKK